MPQVEIPFCKPSAMKKNLAEIAPRLRLTRNLLRISQRDFARRLQISLSHFAKLEAGIGGISEALLIAIAKEANVDLAWLRNGLGKAPALPKKRGSILSLEQIEALIAFTEDAKVQALAKKIAHTTGCSEKQALVNLGRELLHNQLVAEN